MAELFINRIRKAVLNQLGNEKFGVGELASKVGLSRSQVLRKIKSATGKSVNQFIREIRLEEAEKLLRQTDFTASEIAYKVGFSSPSYFNKCFLERYNITPGEYKKQKTDNNSDELISAKTTDKPALKRKPVLSVLIIFVAVIAGYLLIVNPVKETSTRQTSIAVLPLLDLSENKDKDYLADGITEAITLELSKYESLRVISRGSSMKFKNEKKVYSEIAEELGVDLLLEGSVLHDADSLRVVVQLIEPFPKEKHVWASSYDQNSSNILQLVGKVSNEIAREISSVVEPDENNSTGYRVNPQAYDLYLRGRHLWNTQKTRYYSLQKALDYINDAIGIDPEFAPAYVIKAETYLSINKLIGDNEEILLNREKARDAINRAFQLDNSMAEAHITKGNLVGKFDWDWLKMKKFVDKGLSFDPSNVNGHIALSDYYVVKGDYKKAIEEALIAEELDPLNPAAGCLVAERYYINGDYQKSIEKYNQVLELNPNYGFAYNGIGFVYFKVGNETMGVESWRKLQNIMGNEKLGSCYDSADDYKDCFRFYLENAKQNAPRFCANPNIISSIHMLLKEENGAIDYLKIAFQYKNEDLPVALTLPEFYPLYDSSEFWNLVEKVGVSIPHVNS